MKVLLVSDTHISNFIEAKEFSDFLCAVCKKESIDRIIFLGDIFDFIFLYRGKYFTPNYIPFYKAIWAFEESGVEVDFFTGNHDIWVSEVFKEHFNVRAHTEHFKVLDINGEKSLFSHGDRIVNRKMYNLLQIVLRSKVAIFLFSLLPPWLGDKIAFFVSHLSRKANCEPDYEVASKIRNHVAEIARKNGCKNAFCGHTHISEVSSVNGIVYGNPGSWRQDGSYIIVEHDNSVACKKFSGEVVVKLEQARLSNML